MITGSSGSILKGIEREDAAAPLVRHDVLRSILNGIESNLLNLIRYESINIVAS